MTMTWMYSFGVFSLATNEIISPTAAWLLIVLLLAVSCVALWLLSAPSRHALSEHTAPPPPRGTRTARALSPPWTKHPPFSRPRPLAHSR
jgi:hypothetical protein